MRKTRTSESESEMSIEEQRSFRQWLVGNFVLASLFAGMLIAMAGLTSLVPAERSSDTTVMTSAR